MHERNQGISLLEVAIAISVLGVVALTLVGSLALGARAEQEMHDYNMALWTAQSEMERVVAWPDFTTIATQFDAQEFAVVGLEPVVAGGFPGAIVVDDTDPDMLRVFVRVEWMEAGQFHSLEVATSVANPEGSINIP